MLWQQQARRQRLAAGRGTMLLHDLEERLREDLRKHVTANLESYGLAGKEG
jgi:hypothetical protein